MNRKSEIFSHDNSYCLFNVWNVIKEKCITDWAGEKSVQEVIKLEKWKDWNVRENVKTSETWFMM